MYTDCDATASRWLEEAVKNTGAKPLYTHPAPSIPAAVPDEIEPTIEAIKRILPTANPDEYAACIGADMWNACRAAMLQGAAGNSPAIPDGWVACSERMPDIGTEIFYFCQDDGLRDCGIVSSSNFSGRGDAQLYVHADGYDLRFGVDITHWMPMPAAPQQK
ncbi:DUF551 domain-containing protein [Citrobacter amalonaticus]|nr:DUF551 domain-containing protein [Citrobacter amalonaticus]